MLGKLRQSSRKRRAASWSLALAVGQEGSCRAQVGEPWRSLDPEHSGPISGGEELSQGSPWVFAI
jgi:hypothetical protein